MSGQRGIGIETSVADHTSASAVGGRIVPIITAWRGAWPTARLAIVYIALYLALDRISFIEALHGFDITPWNPPAGLTLALLVAQGLSLAPAVFVAAFMSSQLLPLAHVPLIAGIGGAAVITSGYTVAAAILRRILIGRTWLQDVRDTVLFIVVAVAAAGIISAGFVAAYAITGAIPWSEFRQAAFRDWIGDAIGVVVLTPVVLVLTERLAHPRRWRWNWRAAVEVVAQWAAIAAALALVFGFHQHRYAFELFYLLFLPLVWAAARHGLPGASAAVFTIQAGLITALELQDLSASAVLAFQLLMFAVAATGLLLGAAVSERQRVSRDLAESRGRLATIVNTARDGMVTIDAHGIIQSANPATDRLFGYPAGSLIGCGVGRLLAAPDPLERLAEMSACSSGEAAPWELDALRIDATPFPVEVTIGRFDSADEGRYTLVIRDIAARRRAEARAREHQSELAHVSRVSLAGEMASVLAHELNQPLMSITTFGRGCLRLLRQAHAEPHLLHDGINEIVQQAERAGDIISRLREFLRPGSYQTSTVTVESLVDGAITLARIEATQSHIDLRVGIAPRLPVIDVDRVQIEQVLLNLLRNAIEAIGDGEPRTVTLEARRKAGPAVEFIVSDTGPGLADEIAGRIFEPFVTTKASGMGLGLSISRSIIEGHGGQLRLVRSGPAGTVFAFDLPVRQIQASRA
jgi:PAS domain S-box-containing protein